VSVLIAVRTALTSGSPALRVWYGYRPQGLTAAGVVFSIVDIVDDEHLRGDSNLARVRVQVDAYSTDAKESESLSDEARALMLASPLFQAITVLGLADFEDDTGLYRFTRDFAVWFRR
jgi:hypothetical protein